MSIFTFLVLVASLAFTITEQCSLDSAIVPSCGYVPCNWNTSDLWENCVNGFPLDGDDVNITADGRTAKQNSYQVILVGNVNLQSLHLSSLLIGGGLPDMSGFENYNQILTFENITMTIGIVNVNARGLINLDTRSSFTAPVEISSGGKVVWLSGDFNGNLRIRSSASFLINGSLPRHFDGVISNSGVITFGSSFKSILSFDIDSQFGNEGGGVIRLNSGTLKSDSVIFRNNGTVLIDPNGEASIDMPFVNYGLLEVPPKVILRTKNTFLSEGKINVTGHLTLGNKTQFSGKTTCGGTILSMDWLTITDSLSFSSGGALINDANGTIFFPGMGMVTSTNGTGFISNGGSMGGIVTIGEGVDIVNRGNILGKIFDNKTSTYTSLSLFGNFESEENSLVQFYLGSERTQINSEGSMKLGGIAQVIIEEGFVLRGRTTPLLHAKQIESKFDRVLFIADGWKRPSNCSYITFDYSNTTFYMVCRDRPSSTTSISKGGEYWFAVVIIGVVVVGLLALLIAVYYRRKMGFKQLIEEQNSSSVNLERLEESD